MISMAAAGLLVLVHLTAVTLTASISSNILSLSRIHISNLTLPLNGTLSGYLKLPVQIDRGTNILPPNRSARPPNPLPIEIPNSELIVIFSSYGNILPSSAVDQAIQAGLNDCIYKAPSTKMPKRRIRYTEPQLERVNVKVTSRTMSWGDWNLVLKALKKFVSDWESMVLNFNVVERSQPLASIGRGYIEDNSDSDGENGVRQS